MTDSTTTNYGWSYPIVNADADTWGATVNTTIQAIDGQVHTNALAALQKAANLSDVANIATSCANLGLTIGTNVQAHDGKLDSFSALAGTANSIPYFSGSNTLGAFTIGTGLAFSGGVLSAPLTSVAGRTGAVTLANTDISGLGTASTHAATDFDSAGAAATAQSTAISTAEGASCQRASNLSDVASAATALSNLGAKNFATKVQTVSTSAPSGTPADGDMWIQHA